MEENIRFRRRTSPATFATGHYVHVNVSTTVVNSVALVFVLE